MDINNFVIDLHQLILAVFYKEAVLVFMIFCAMFFVLAAMVATWAYKSGEFNNMEISKFEMLEDMA